MANEELDALVIRNMKQARLAYERLEHAVAPVVQHEIERAFETAVKQLGWGGGFEWDDDDLWAAPPEWVAEDADADDPSYLGRAILCSDNADGEGAAADHLWLVSLCQEGRARYGIRLDRADGLGLKPPRWRKVANGHPAAQRLIAQGFLYDDKGQFFHPVDFTAEALAAAIESGDFEPFVRPLQDVMSRLPEAASAFGEILSTARDSAGA